MSPFLASFMILDKGLCKSCLMLWCVHMFRNNSEADKTWGHTRTDPIWEFACTVTSFITCWTGFFSSRHVIINTRKKEFDTIRDIDVINIAKYWADRPKVCDWYDQMRYCILWNWIKQSKQTKIVRWDGSLRKKKQDVRMHVKIWAEESMGLMLCYIGGQAKYTPTTGGNGCTLVPVQTPALFTLAIYQIIQYFYAC